MSQGGTGKEGARPHAFDQAMSEMGADRFLAATNPAEMGIGAQSDNTAAVRTKIAFEMQGGGKALKVPGGEAVSMDLVMVASRTDFGPLPRIFFALLKNILEKDSNKTYHGTHVFGGKPQVENRAESLPELSARFVFPGTKKD